LGNKIVKLANQILDQEKRPAREAMESHVRKAARCMNVGLHLHRQLN
jgi:hypothetical protein